ncbi:MAG: hypothetical protein ACREI6_11680 [Candidatus Rokuibacteriota bacterium]
MKAIKTLVLAITAMLAVAPMTAPAGAVSAPSGIDPRIRLDWDAGTRRGKPVIQGYVYNDHGRPAADVRLLVETLDASGAGIAQTIGFVYGVVPFNNRAYFEVPIKVAGPSYRVTVTSLDWRGGGGGGP